MKYLSYEDLNEYSEEIAVKTAYKRIYIDSNLDHICDYEWYRTMIYPYTLGGKNPNE